MDLYEKLFDIYTKSITINDFVKNVTREINNPIALVNENFQIIAYSDNDLYNDQFYDEATKNGYRTLSFSKRIYDEFSDGSEYKIIDFINEHRRLFIKLMYQDRFIGYCVVLEINRKLEDLDKNFLKAATMIFAKSIYTFDPIYKDISNESFIVNLINHLYQNRQIFLERLKRTDIKQNDSSYILLFDLNNIKNRKEDEFLIKARQINPKFILVFKDNYLLAFSEETLNDNIVDKLDNLLFTYKIEGIISSRIIDLYMLDVIYRLNIKLLKRLSSSLKEYRLFNEENYKMILPFLEIDDKLLLYSFINTKIMQLHNFDSLNNSNLIDTLYIYLINDRSLNEASKLLYLHKNTILYRLDKIKEQFGLNLDSQGEKISYISSIALLYYLENRIDKIKIN